MYGSSLVSPGSPIGAGDEATQKGLWCSSTIQLLSMHSLVPRPSLPAFNVACKEHIESRERGLGDKANQCRHEWMYDVRPHLYLNYMYHEQEPKLNAFLMLT